ncbi:MAG: hypothetical protein NY202_05785 [Mollicutes bacterium UO1]
MVSFPILSFDGIVTREYDEKSAIKYSIGHRLNGITYDGNRYKIL